LVFRFLLKNHQNTNNCKISPDKEVVTHFFWDYHPLINELPLANNK